MVWDIRSSKPQCLWGNRRDLEPFTICRAIWRSCEGSLAVRRRVMPQTAAVCAQRREQGDGGTGSSERLSRWSLGRTWRFRRLCNERHASEVHKRDMCNNSFLPVFMWDGVGKVLILENTSRTDRECILFWKVDLWYLWFWNWEKQWHKNNVVLVKNVVKREWNVDYIVDFTEGA